ncbi:hypothetical protein INR49_032963 [Caranx melampygus]|nr:hypothetical protein INR49_032963 [Caranx melampygus]
MGSRAKQNLKALKMAMMEKTWYQHKKWCLTTEMPNTHRPNKSSHHEKNTNHDRHYQPGSLKTKDHTNQRGFLQAYPRHFVLPESLKPAGNQKTVPLQVKDLPLIIPWICLKDTKHDLKMSCPQPELEEMDCPPPEELECKICYQRYNAHNRKPKILDCLHRVCARCLIKILDIADGAGCISCPFCRHQTEITEFEISALPDDANIMSHLAMRDKSWNSDHNKEVVLTPKSFSSSSPSHDSSNCLVITIMEVQRNSQQSPSRSDIYTEQSLDSVSMGSNGPTDQDTLSKFCNHVPRILVWLLAAACSLGSPFECLCNAISVITVYLVYVIKHIETSTNSSFCRFSTLILLSTFLDDEEEDRMARAAFLCTSLYTFLGAGDGRVWSSLPSSFSKASSLSSSSSSEWSGEDKRGRLSKSSDHLSLKKVRGLGCEGVGYEAQQALEQWTQQGSNQGLCVSTQHTRGEVRERELELGKMGYGLFQGWVLVWSAVGRLSVLALFSLFFRPQLRKDDFLDVQRRPSLWKAVVDLAQRRRKAPHKEHYSRELNKRITEQVVLWHRRFVRHIQYILSYRSRVLSSGPHPHLFDDLLVQTGSLVLKFASPSLGKWFLQSDLSQLEVKQWTAGKEALNHNSTLEHQSDPARPFSQL